MKKKKLSTSIKIAFTSLVLSVISSASFLFGFRLMNVKGASETAYILMVIALIAVIFASSMSIIAVTIHYIECKEKETSIELKENAEK